MTERSPAIQREQHPLGRGGARLQAIVFLVSIWIPLVWGVVEPDRAISGSEKRRMAPWPGLEWTASSLTSLPARLGHYYDDHVGLRLPLIRARAVLWIEGFGRSPSPQLVVGREGWLFFGDDAALAQARGDRLDLEELEAWRLFLEAESEALAERGARFLVVFAPNKHSIYPEYLPSHFGTRSPRRGLAELVAYLRETSEVPVLDLGPLLLEAKSEQRVYHLTDTHWNDAGAAAASRAIVEASVPLLAGFSSPEPVATTSTRMRVPGMGLAGIVGLSDRYYEEVTSMRPRRPQARVAPAFRDDYAERVRTLRPFVMQAPVSGGARVVVFRDSFANALVQFLSESFARVAYVWSRNVDLRIVEAESPDLVILQMAERFIGTVPTRRPIVPR